MTITKRELEMALGNYNLGRLNSYHVPRQGLLNQVVFLETTKGKFVLKIALVNESSLDYVLELLQHIKMALAPRLILTNNKKLYFLYSGHKAFIYPFFAGKIPGRITKGMLGEIGKFLAEFHRRSHGFEKSFRREEILSLSPASIRQAISHAKGVRSAKDKAAVRYIEKTIREYTLPSNLPAGPIHVDVKPDNSLFNRGKLQGVVDFDNVYQGPLVLDLAVAMSWYGIGRGKVYLAKLKELYFAYTKIRKFKPVEEQALFNAFHFVVLRNALRALEFLAADRLPAKWVHDYLNNYLKAESNFAMSRQEFINYLKKDKKIRNLGKRHEKK